MKKLLFGSTLAACLIVLSSCLDGGSNESSGSAVGIIEYKGMKPLIRVADGDSYANLVSSTYIDSEYTINDGDCCLFAYTIDEDSPENKNASTLGYRTATVSGYAKLTEVPEYPYLTDTTSLMENEIIINQMTIANFINNRLFMEIVHNNSLTDQKVSYEISYDQNQKPEVVNSKKYYNLFIRARKTENGKSPSINLYTLTAFEIDRFIRSAIQQEKAANAKELNIKLNFISKFNADTTAVGEWGKLELLPYPFAEE